MTDTTEVDKDYEELKDACGEMLDSWVDTGLVESHMFKIHHILNKQMGHLFDHRDDGKRFCKKCLIPYNQRFKHKCGKK